MRCRHCKAPAVEVPLTNSPRGWVWVHAPNPPDHPRIYAFCHPTGSTSVQGAGVEEDDA